MDDDQAALRTHSSASNDETGSLLYWWRANVRDFSDDTTFHGCKYVCGSAQHLIRKLLWLLVLLAASGLFFFMLSSNIIRLSQNTVNVDISDQYVPALTFPAVTVCNENPYRMTALFQLGIYDLMKFVRANQSLDEATYGQYNYLPNVCDVNKTLSMHVHYMQLVVNVSLAACEYLCYNDFHDNCSGIFWNRLAGQCWLTSYTGDSDATKDDTAEHQYGDNTTAACTNPSDPWHNWMYLRRHRVPYTMAIYCDFERFDNCPLQFTVQSWCTEKFYVTRGADISTGPIFDITLSTNDGHVIYLTSQQYSANTCADVITDYISTAGQCVMVHYQWLPRGKVSVLLRNEDHVEVEVKTVTSDNQDSAPEYTWLMLLVALPTMPGVQQVIIRATRPITLDGNHDFTGVVLDDLTVRPCTEFGRECLLSASGAEYMGGASRGRRGDACQSWINTPLPIYYLHTIFNASLVLYGNKTDLTTLSQCRNVDYDPRGPWCYGQEQEKLYCDVTHCACPAGWFRCIQSGVCVMADSVCDGQAQCSDGSDEDVTVCGRYMSTNCKFDDATTFMCGYHGWQGMSSLWTLDSGNPDGSGLLSANWQSQVSSTATAVLVSPVFSWDSSVAYSFIKDNPGVKFDIYATCLIRSGQFNISILLLRDDRIITRPSTPLSPYTYDQVTWYLFWNVCVMPGHSLVIAPTVPSTNEAQPEYRMVYISGFAGCNENYHTDTASSVSCKFSSQNKCDYVTFEDHSAFQWLLQPLSGGEVWKALLYRSSGQAHSRAILASGVQRVNTSSCVHFTLGYAPGAAVRVRVPKCINTADDDGLLLKLVGGGDGTWNPIWLPLTVSSAGADGEDRGCDAQLQWEVEYNSNPGDSLLAAALGDVTVLPGSCLEQDVSVRDNLGCDLMDGDQCGYRDVSEGSVRWLRRLLTSQDIQYDVFVYSTAAVNISKVTSSSGRPVGTVVSSSSLVTRVSYSPTVITQLFVRLLHTNYAGPWFVAIATNQGRLGAGSLMCDSWRSDDWSNFHTSLSDTASCYNYNTTAQLPFSVQTMAGAQWPNVSAADYKDMTEWTNSARVSPLVLPYPDTRLIVVPDTYTNCVLCNATLASLDGDCLTATGDGVCGGGAISRQMCWSLGCCYNRDTKTCMASVLYNKTYVMTVNLPANETSEARMMSSEVKVVRSGCLSFLIYFNIDVVNVTVGYTSARASKDQQLLLGYATLGSLLYPFDTQLLVDGENSRLFRMYIDANDVALIADQSVRFVFIASGSGDSGSVSVWQIQYSASVQCANSRFWTVSSAASESDVTLIKDQSTGDVDLRRPEDLPAVDTDWIFVSNDDLLLNTLLDAFNSMTVTELIIAAGNHRDTLILDCQWDNAACPRDSLTDRLTDLGLCFTFNLDSTQNSSNAGSKNGLQLLLHVEDYEQVDGLVTLSGVKVFMFDPTKQVELMSEVSYSVSPGTATDISLATSNNIFLPDPFTNCNDETLYSHSTCVLQCMTDAFINLCNCTDVNMPGNYSRCLGGEYLSCSPWNVPASKQQQQCVSACVPECNVTAYSGTITFSQLSSLATKSLLDAHRNSFDNHYTNARHLYDRLTHSNSYLTYVTSLAQSTLALTEIINATFHHVNAFNTSLYTFDRFVWADMKSAQEELTSLRTEYDTEYGQVRRKAATYLEEAVSCLRDFLMLVLSPPGDLYTSTFYEQQRFYTGFSLVTSDCQRSVSLALAYLTQAANQDGVLGIVFSNSYASCSAAFSQSADVIAWLSAAQPLLSRAHRVAQQWLDSNVAQVSATNDDQVEAIFWMLTSNNGTLTRSSISTMVTATSWLLIDDCVKCGVVASALQNYHMIANLTASSEFAAQCLLPYEQALNDAVQCASAGVHLTAFPFISITESLKNATTYLADTNAQLSSLIRSYLIGAVTGLQCATLAQTSLQNMAHAVQTTHDELSSLADSLTATLSKAGSDIFATYNALAGNVTRVYQHCFRKIMPLCGEGLLNAVSGWYIWQQPRVIIEPVATAVLANSRSASQTAKAQLLQQVWDADSLNATVWGAVIDVLSDVQSSVDVINTLISDWTNERAIVDTQLTSYKNGFALDDNFIRKNFIQLNVYYDQLKIQSTEQTAAYGFVSFFSDLGGLLGLFLGGSAISLFEVVDLFAYNLLLQMLGRWRDNRAARVNDQQHMQPYASSADMMFSSHNVVSVSHKDGRVQRPTTDAHEYKGARERAEFGFRTDDAFGRSHTYVGPTAAAVSSDLYDAKSLTPVA